MYKWVPFTNDVANNEIDIYFVGVMQLKGALVNQLVYYMYGEKLAGAY